VKSGERRVKNTNVLTLKVAWIFHLLLFTFKPFFLLFFYKKNKRKDFVLNRVFIIFAALE